MARFRPGPGLDARIAQRFAVPHARRLADALADRMRDNAPDAAAWLCFAPDTRVAAGGVVAVSRRTETAELLRLTFRAPDPATLDRVLTVTANHKVLTAQGWLPADRLKVGTYAIGSASLGRGAVVAPHEHDSPPTIAEVFRSASKAWAATAEGMMGRVLDFDGEPGAAVDHGDVDVVPVDGVLRDELDAHARQVLPQRVLSATDLDLAAPLLGPGLRRQGFGRATAVRHGARRLAVRLKRGRLIAHPSQPARIPQRAGGGLPLGQDPANRGLAAPVSRGEHPLAEPLGVELCQLVAVDVVPASCHVYDLLTDRGWLVADGIVAHNSAQDERVRPTHHAADGQTIPDNLRFWIEKPSGGHESAQAPRDPDLSIENRASCRCLSVHLPGLIAERVQAGDVVLRRAAAHA